MNIKIKCSHLDKGNALMLLPPTVAAGETLDVEIMDVVLRNMWIVSANT